MAKRWKTWPAAYYAENPRVDAFLAEIEAVCEKHGLSLAHEDVHGAFIVVDFTDGRAGLFENAHDGTSDGGKG